MPVNDGEGPGALRLAIRNLVSEGIVRRRHRTGWFRAANRREHCRRRRPQDRCAHSRQVWECPPSAAHAPAALLCGPRAGQKVELFSVILRPTRYTWRLVVCAASSRGLRLLGSHVVPAYAQAAHHFRLAQGVADHDHSPRLPACSVKTPHGGQLAAAVGGQLRGGRRQAQPAAAQEGRAVQLGRGLLRAHGRRSKATPRWT